MEAALAAIWAFAKRLPPKWRAPAAIILVVGAGAGWLIMGGGYETQSAHAADVKSLKDADDALSRRLDGIPSAEDNAKAVVDAINADQASRAALKRAKGKRK